MSATKQSWKTLPLGAALPVPFQRAFATDEFERLRAGLIPQSMDDKWFVYFEDPNLFLHRSWGGTGVYRVTLKSEGDAFIVAEALCAKEVLKSSFPEYEAALLDFLIGNLLLGETKDFPRPPFANKRPAGLLQHVIAGTGFRESAESSPRRSWWVFWKA